MRKSIIAVFMVLFIGIMAFPDFVQADSSDDIIIFYENDVHCEIDGYAILAALKNEYEKTYEHVGIVSNGDYAQGSGLGSNSKGEWFIEVQNLVGYEALALGNHEFDYGLQQLMKLEGMMEAKPVCSNFASLEDGDTVFDPYRIVSYGDVDVAYIGVTTPDTMMTSAPSQFLDKDGEAIYTFHGEDLTDTVQKSIDAAEEEGAEYIVVLSHSGTEDVYEEWSAQTIVENTEGIDVLLDGHSHSVEEGITLKDKAGNDVVISSTGTKFANIGKLTISEDGDITTELIERESVKVTDSNRDEEVEAYIEKRKEDYDEIGGRLIGTSEVDLISTDESGKRVIRFNETNLGNLCSDALRFVTGADISAVNGGGIRADIPKGDVTYNSLLSVFPYYNDVCVIEVTGQQIADFLEFGAATCPAENGLFLQCSGITYNIDLSVPTPVKQDENRRFDSIDGARRVSNIKILNGDTNEYEPIDLEGLYSLASTDFLVNNTGSEATMMLDSKILLHDGTLDTNALEEYITENLNGVIGEEYAEKQNRITWEEGVSDSVIAAGTVKNGSELTVLWITIAGTVVMMVAAGVMIRRKSVR